MKRRHIPPAKAWSGRFAKPTDEAVERFCSSLSFDQRLYEEDIEASIAHCRMLAKQKIISQREARQIIRGLNAIREEFRHATFVPLPTDEDIHMAVERRLYELAGPVAGKLHTARSRNDQIATDLRLFVRRHIAEVDRRLRTLQEALGAAALRELHTVAPGFTHLQPAQPILLSHHLLAYAAMLERDRSRLADQLPRVNVLPLGSGALAGTTFNIDRNYVAKLLKFSAISMNSLDAVSDRDFIVEFLAALALIGVHLSRFCEDLILWSSAQFSFVDLPEEFATGSSMMPQKKNPDVAELIRGKSGRLVANLVSLLVTLKGLPMSYNRDLQEDKEPLFDSVDAVESSLDVLARMVSKLRFNRERMREAATAGFTLATELADYLASKGIPFREAHEIVGRIVRYCVERKRRLEELSLAELRSFCSKFDESVRPWLDPLAAVARRQAPGGTSPENVKAQLRALKLSTRSVS
ncbi:Argininosuccinate lyase [bacterium HR30]|nr:Argininosuccinate lyase [bacterium HR30]